MDWKFFTGYTALHLNFVRSLEFIIVDSLESRDHAFEMKSICGVLYLAESLRHCRFFVSNQYDDQQMDYEKLLGPLKIFKGRRRSRSDCPKVEVKMRGYAKEFIETPFKLAREKLGLQGRILLSFTDPAYESCKPKPDVDSDNENYGIQYFRCWGSDNATPGSPPLRPGILTPSP